MILLPIDRLQRSRLRMSSGTVAGARASADLYALVETAKANGIEPHAYLTHVFERLPLATTVERSEALLLWKFQASRTA